MKNHVHTLTSEKLAYLAGLFDGEGCVGIYHQPKMRSSYLRVQVVQNRNQCVVDLFSEIASTFGGFVRFQKTYTENTKCCYDAAGDTGCRFLEAIFPYVVFKREQVALGITWHRQRMPLQRDSHGRVMTRENSTIEFDYQSATLSRLLKTSTLNEITVESPQLRELAERLRLPDVLTQACFPSLGTDTW